MLKRFFAVALCALMLACLVPFGAFATEEGFVLSALPDDYAGYDPIPLIVIVVSYDANGNGIDDCKAGKSSTNKNSDVYGEQWAYTTEDEWEQSVFGDEGKTIKNYYLDMSEGNFCFTPAKETYGKADNGVVYVTIDIPHPDAVAKKNGTSRSEYDTRVKALQAAAEYVDFSSYDKNGNGYIDYTELSISFIVAGYNEKWGGGSNGKQIWGMNNYQMHTTKTGVNVDGVNLCNGLYGGRFTVDGECRNDLGKPNQIITIGTLTHELGHVLGAVDLYTYSGYTWIGGPGNKALQGTGSNNYRTGERSGTSPAAIDPYHLIMYGFEKAQVVNDGTYTLYSRETEEGYNIIRVNTTDPNIYYLIENRYTEDSGSYDGNIGDSALSYGIIVWRVHQDIMDKYSLPNCVENGDESEQKEHTRAGLEPAYSGVTTETVKLYEYTKRNVKNNKIQSSETVTVEGCSTTVEILSEPGLEMQIKVTNAVQMPVEFAFSNNESTTDSVTIMGLIKELNMGDVKKMTGIIKTKKGEVIKTENIVFEKDGSFTHTFTGLTPDTSYVCEVSVEGTQEFSAKTVSVNVFTNPVVVEITDRYTVTFYKNLTDNDSGYNMTVKTGEKISYSFPMRKSGYAFCGWYLDAEFTQPFDINSFTQEEAKSFSLYAKWVASTEAATLKLSGAAAENKIFSVLPGEKFIEPVVAEKEGFEFLGWFADEALTVKFDFSAPVTQNGTITVYAGWKDLSAPAQTTTDTVTTTVPVTADPVSKGNATLVIIIVAVACILAAAAAVAVVMVKKKKK